MVDASEKYWSKKATLEFGNQKVDATLAVTEGGRPVVELDNEISQNSKPDLIYEKIEGTTIDGEEVILKYVTTQVSHLGESKHRIRSVNSVREIEIDGIGQDPFVDEKVVIKFDILCFMPYYPTTYTSRDFQIIERNDWKAVGKFSSQIEKRKEFIKSRRHPLRTSTIIISQEDQNGPPRVQVKTAQPRINTILDISSFLLGVGCSSYRVKIEKGDEIYTRIWTSHRNIGSAFTGNILVWGEIGNLVDLAYDWYADETRNDYKIESVIGYYLDSINVTRTVEGQLSTLFNGIELLAKRHTDYGPQFTSTPKRLEYLVKTLDVKVSDLAEHSIEFSGHDIDNTYEPSWKEKLATLLLSQLRRSDRLSIPANYIERKMIRDGPIPEYFYSKTRQYIVHGDNQSTYDGDYERLVADLESSKVFMQRLLRNRLFGRVDTDTYSALGNLAPNKFDSDDT